MCCISGWQKGKNIKHDLWKERVHGCGESLFQKILKTEIQLEPVKSLKPCDFRIWEQK